MIFYVILTSDYTSIYDVLMIKDFNKPDERFSSATIRFNFSLQASITGKYFKDYMLVD